MKETTEELITGLGSEQPVERQRCRHRLVNVGTAAVQPLMALMDSEDDHLRWEAARALAAIADPSSVPTLVRALEDSDESVRWDAAVGLASIGRSSVEAVLLAVTQLSQSGAIEGTHHVIHELAHTDWGRFLYPVYEAFNASEPLVSAPVAAEKALEEWRRKG